MNERIAIGVDAGGTGVRAIASRGGTESGTGRAGPANASSRGVPAAAEAIAEAVRQAADGAQGFTLFVGAAGAGRDEVARELMQALCARLPHAASVHVEEDARIALRAGLPHGPGIALLAGTGSAAYAEHGEVRVRVGGAGYLLGDEGSGFALGAAALRACVRVFDGRAPGDALTKRVSEAFGAAGRDELLGTIYGAGAVDAARVARLAQEVLALAGSGDRAAQKIVQNAARELGDLVCAAAKQADLTEHSPAIVFSGGLLRENSLLTYVLQTRLQSDIAGAFIVRSTHEPARAALTLAERSLTEPAR